MKVVTLNLANYDDHRNWDQRVRMIAEDLIGLEPDLAALQEVRFNPDNASTHVSYQNMAEQVLATIRHSKGGRAWEGTKILTQPAMYYPMVDNKENPWQYPRPSIDQDRAQEWEGLTILSRGTAPETGNVFLSMNQACTDTTRATNIELFATEPNDNGVYASDHFGLCVTFDS